MTLPSKSVHGPIPKGTKISYLKKYFCNHIHSVSIYITKWKVQPKCSLADGQMNKMWFLCKEKNF